MTYHHTQLITGKSPAPTQSAPVQQASAPDRPLGRYCGHVFLYWDPDHFQKASLALSSKATLQAG